MEIILSTRNPSKLQQIQKLFEGSTIKLLTLDDAGIIGEGVEDGTTLEENAEKKARFAQKHAPGKWIMAEDTGLFITALDGEPGIYAARWAGEHASTQETLAYCIQRMEGAEDRSAVFRAFVVVLTPENKKHVFEGEVHGTLLEEPNSEPQAKMPYSGLFVPDGETLAWSEMTIEKENEISHRGKVFRKVKAYLERANKATCAILLNKENEVLLIKRGREPYKGMWALVSGIGETRKGLEPAEAVVGEIEWDLGTRSFIGKELFTLPSENNTVADEVVVFAGTINETEIALKPGFSEELRWIPAAEAKNEKLAFEHTQILQKYCSL
jgi:XTP/dITP diphosphohydrolase